MTLRHSLRRARRAGFTLIELLAVMLIIGILAVALLPMITGALGTAEVTACEQNLSAIYQGILQYKIKYDNELPNKSGVSFFAQLYSRRALEQSKTNAERLTCPAVQKSALTIGTLPWEEWWIDLDLVDGSYSAYAGRDLVEHPLRKLTAKEPLVCDDNDGGMNHDTTTNVLYGDGSVQASQFEIVILQEQGILGPDEEVLLVGPDSPVEDLQKFTLD